MIPNAYTSAAVVILRRMNTSGARYSAFLRKEIRDIHKGNSTGKTSCSFGHTSSPTVSHETIQNKIVKSFSMWQRTPLQIPLHSPFVAPPETTQNPWPSLSLTYHTMKRNSEYLQSVSHTTFTARTKILSNLRSLWQRRNQREPTRHYLFTNKWKAQPRNQHKLCCAHRLQPTYLWITACKRLV